MKNENKENENIWWRRHPFNFAVGRGGLHIRVRRWWLQIAWRPFALKTGSWL